MDLQQLETLFLHECEDHAAAATAHLDALSSGAAAGPAFDGMFRAVHSVKGGARAFGYPGLADFCHALESLLDRHRKSGDAPSEDGLRLLFDSVDGLDSLVRAAPGDKSVAPDPDLLRRVAEAAGLAAQDPATAAPPPGPAGGAAEPQPEAGAGEGRGLRRYVVRLRPTPRLQLDRVDPLTAIRQLRALGDAEVEAEAGGLPGLDELDPLACRIAWTVRLETAAGRDEIDDVLSMIDDVVDVAVDEEGGQARDGAGPPDAPALAPPPVGGVPAVIPPAPAPPTADAGPRASARAAPPPDGAAALRASAAHAVVRVDASKLERLGNMVGELVITQAVLQEQLAEIGESEQPGVFRALKELSQRVRDLQDASMSLQTQPMRLVFARIPQLLRDLERATGKRVRLVTSGDATEIDKTVAERLFDPLVHLIRNAVDHGIEAPAVREAAGKDPVGTLAVGAQQRGSQIVIAIQDDGAGIRRAAVRARAVERGLVPAGADLDDQEIDELIFLPGFSTASSVTDVSGRGVGMDAVRTAIGDLGGQVTVRSQEGAGSLFQLTLPLSLAIMDAVVATVGGERYLLPATAVLESFRPSRRDVADLPGIGTVLNLRGTALPLVDLREQFGMPGRSSPSEGIVMITASVSGRSLAVAVDDVIGLQSVVVKSLERNLHRIPGVSAATILGDGRAALILDVASLETMRLGAASFAVSAHRSAPQPMLAGAAR